MGTVEMPPEALVHFIYMLARDHMTVGTINEMVINARSFGPSSVYTDRELAAWARAKATKLMPPVEPQEY